ncbi:hydroxyacid dehydrogenase [Halobacteriales archaeon QS_1_68_17]|nr:MAG: hydroxyacid dehydrogenase [Halobacteriales archaeon QS_1_68_17]
MVDQADVVVFRRNFHGLPADDYARALRERLDDLTVAVARTPREERELVRTAAVATGSHFDESLLGHVGDLQLFACAYAGVDHLPVDELAERGVTVTTASGVHGPNVAEHIVGTILLFTRRFQEGLRRQRHREWRSYPTRELAGSTVAIVGLGAIGTATADRLDAFDVETVGVRYTPAKGGPTDEVVGFDELDEALAEAAYVVLACPLTDETEGLIGAAELNTIHPDAVLVNVARGPVVETDALVAALRKNHLRGAALDVTDPEPLPEDHPLWNFENVLITPHNAGFTPV